MPSQRAGLQKARINQRKTARDHRWDQLVGWPEDAQYEDYGIDSWTKKRRHQKNAKSTGRKAAAHKPWEKYACEVGKYCNAISDKEQYCIQSLPGPSEVIAKVTPVVDELKDKVKPTASRQYPQNAWNLQNDDANKGNDESNKGAITKGANASKDAIATDTTSPAVDKAALPAGEPPAVEDSETAQGENQQKARARGGVAEPQSETTVVDTHRLDTARSHRFLTPRGVPTDLACHHLLRESIVRGAVEELQASSGAVSWVLPERAATPVTPQEAITAAQTGPVRLCYTQSNIKLQYPLFPVPVTLPEDTEVGETEGDGGTAGFFRHREEATHHSRCRTARHGLSLYINELNSQEDNAWSDSSEPVVDYRVRLIRSKDGNGSAQGNDTSDKLPLLEPDSHTHGSPIAPIPDHLSHSREDLILQRSQAAMHRQAISANPEEQRPIPLVPKSMVLDPIPNPQRIASRAAVSADNSRTQSARSSSRPAAPSAKSVKRLSRSVDASLDVQFAQSVAQQGVSSNYVNPSYMDRLPSRGMPIGDLLPAVDTNLRTTFATRSRPAHRPGRRGARRQDRCWQKAGEVTSSCTADTIGHGDAMMTERGRLLPYEDNLILLREGLEMLKMCENPQEPRARIHLQHGNCATSSSLYCSTPCPGYDSRLRSTPVRVSVGGSYPNSSPPPATQPVASSNSLTSLYKLSQRRKTREKLDREQPATRPTNKLKPPPKSSAPSVGNHFRELPKLTT